MSDDQVISSIRTMPEDDGEPSQGTAEGEYDSTQATSDEDYNDNESSDQNMSEDDDDDDDDDESSSEGEESSEDDGPSSRTVQRIPPLRWCWKSYKYALLTQFYLRISEHEQVLEVCDVIESVLRGEGEETALQYPGGCMVQNALDRNADSVVFRFEELDLEQIQLAQKVFPGYVLNVVPNGTLADLFVYACKRHNATPYVLLQNAYLNDENCWNQYEKTVEDFAHFCAQPWHNRPAELPEPPATLMADYQKIIDDGCKRLGRQTSEAKYVTNNLHRLFDPNYPMVLHIDDVLGCNMHVEENTGILSGPELVTGTYVAPFGVSLVQVESLLGLRVQFGVKAHRNADDLSKKFWDALHRHLGVTDDEDMKQAIALAHKLGQLIGRFGSRPQHRCIIWDIFGSQGIATKRFGMLR